MFIPVTETLTLGVASVANGVTDTTAGTAYGLRSEFAPPQSFRVTITGTMAAGSTGTLTVTLAVSHDGLTYDTALHSLLTLSATAPASGALQFSDVFDAAGVMYVKVVKIVNGTTQNVTALAAKISYAYQK